MSSYESSSDLLDQVLNFYTIDSLSDYRIDMSNLKQLLRDAAHDDRVRILKKYDSMNRAAMVGHTDILETILTSVQPNERLDVLMVHNYTPLHYAAASGNLGCVETILSHLTADQQLVLMTATDRSGKTSSHWAEERGHESTVSLLSYYKLGDCGDQNIYGNLSG